MSTDAPPVRFHIVTPCRNGDPQLDRTLLSVLLQAGDFTLHYHVQDGGSTDGRWERLAFWRDLVVTGGLPAACRHLRFTIAREPARGAFDAVNRGMAVLMGEDGDWFGWLNAGDLLVPGALQTIARFLVQEPETEWVCGRTATVDETGIALFRDGIPGGYPRRTLAAGLHTGRRFERIQPAGTVWRRSLWVRAGGAIDDSLLLAGGWNLWRRFAAHAEPVVLDRVTGLHRVRDTEGGTDQGAWAVEAASVRARHGLAEVERTVEAEFVTLSGCRDVSGLHEHGFTGRVARFANGEAAGRWDLLRALPSVLPQPPPSAD